MTTKQSVTTRKNGGVPATYDYGADVGAGFENTTKEDYLIPMISVLQTNSPQVSKRDPEYVNGAEPGDFLNPAIGTVWKGDVGLSFIPAHSQHVIVRWAPRGDGGTKSAPLGQLAPDDAEFLAAKAAAEEFGDYHDKDGNDLIETFYLYGVAIDADGNPQQVVFPFSSTKIKRYKALMTKARSVQVDGKQVPLFAHIFRLTSVEEQNAYGKFFNVRAEIDERLAPDSNLYLAARAMRDMAREGVIKADAAMAKATEAEDIL